MTSPSSPGSILTCDTRPALPGPARLHPSRHAGRFRPNSRTGESDTGSKGHYRVRWNSRFGYREESDLLAMVGGDRVPPRGCSVHALLGFAARRSFPVEPVAKLCCAPSPQHVVLRAFFAGGSLPRPPIATLYRPVLWRALRGMACARCAGCGTAPTPPCRSLEGTEVGGANRRTGECSTQSDGGV